MSDVLGRFSVVLLAAYGAVSLLADIALMVTG